MITSKELITKLQEIDPLGNKEVQLDIRLRWGSRPGHIARIDSVQQYSERIIRIIEETDPEV
jgi:hypothetical protein